MVNNRVIRTSKPRHIQKLNLLLMLPNYYQYVTFKSKLTPVITSLKIANIKSSIKYLILPEQGRGSSAKSIHYYWMGRRVFDNLYVLQELPK